MKAGVPHHKRVALGMPTLLETPQDAAVAEVEDFRCTSRRDEPRLRFQPATTSRAAAEPTLPASHASTAPTLLRRSGVIPEYWSRRTTSHLRRRADGFGPPSGLVSSGLMVTCDDVSPYTGDLGLIFGKIAQTSP